MQLILKSLKEPFESMTSLDKTNGINILLMLASLALSIILPFQILLISYAVLGPLHYLTEISWLKDRNFFLKNKTDISIVFLSCIFLLLGCTVILPFKELLFFQQWNLFALYLTFSACLVLVVAKSWFMRVILFLSAVVFSILFMVSNFLSILLVIYLTTLIHVYIFTGAFILSGSLKAKSMSGYLSFAVFIICPIICFLIIPNISMVASDWVQKDYSTTFTVINHVTLSQFFGMPRNIYIDIFNNPLSIMVTRFMAFAYTYHYLNWFSKTSVIKWHRVSKKRFGIIMAFWIGSLILYKINYLIAYKWLFILSYLHVLLEFPLNHHSFLQIAREFKSRVSYTVFSRK